MPTIDSLAKYLETYLSVDEISEVRRSYEYAREAHEGQKRKSGEAYIAHPLSVACILADLQMDKQTLMAAMLHDVIEDTSVSKETISNLFGQTVAELVDGVSKLTHVPFENKRHAQAENFQKMVFAMAKDIRVILVKLADRLHNMRTLQVLKTEKRKRIARETLDIYAPIAQRLGMHQVKVEFEDLCLKAIYPLRFQMLKKAVEKAQGSRTNAVCEIARTISDNINKQNISCIVTGREKHLFSIYQKMKKQRRSFVSIMDVIGIRVIVENIDQCYRVLGIVHNLYKPIPGRFKDYIAIPKANGYRSLHTTLFSRKAPFEVQIRTHNMEDMGNKGIACHELYKSNSELAAGSHHRTKLWLQNLLELQSKADSSLEFIEHVKVDLFPDEVYVFSPAGEIFELPKGATVVDFAFAVHTKLGLTCVACRIDQELASLSQTLESGQTIEIITAQDATPNAGWLDFVITGKAHSNIRHFIKHQKQAHSVALGKRLLERALLGLGKTIETIDQDMLSKVLLEGNLTCFDQLVESIGIGDRIGYVVAKKLVYGMPHKDQECVQLTNSFKPLSISGNEGMVIAYAKCCYPIPGDLVVGHVSSGRGLVIHQETCKKIKDIRFTSEKVIEVNWIENIKGNFSVKLTVTFERQLGIIALLATAVTKASAGIEKISVDEVDELIGKASILLSVKNRAHLAQVIKRLRTIRNIKTIIRFKTA